MALIFRIVIARDIAEQQYSLEMVTACPQRNLGSTMGDQETQKGARRRRAISHLFFGELFASAFRLPKVEC